MGGANGLIVAFVVAVWAAYFVPLVLRRYDEASSSESLDTLSPLSRVVHRRRPEADESATDLDVESNADQPSRRPAPQSTPQAPSARPTVTRQAAIIAARRRRRTLLTLLTALVLVGGLAVFSVVSPVWVAAPAALIVAWLVACRVQVRAERGISRAKAPVSTDQSHASAAERPQTAEKGKRRGLFARTEAPQPSVDDEATIVVSGQFEDVDPGRRHVMERAELEVDALDEKLQIAVPSVSADGTALWDPLPVTLPTYVTKPRVGRTVRTIDFDAPGTWTSGHVEGEDVELPQRSTGTADAAVEQPRRASGE